MIYAILSLLFLASIAFWLEARQTEKERKNKLDEDGEYTLFSSHQRKTPKGE